MTNLFILCFFIITVISLIKKDAFAKITVITADIILLAVTVATIRNIKGYILCAIYLASLWIVYLITKNLKNFLDYDISVCAQSIKRLETVNTNLDKELNWMDEEIEFLKKGYSHQRVLTEMLWKMSNTMEFHHIFNIFVEHAKKLVSFEEFRLVFIFGNRSDLSIERQYVYPQSAEEMSHNELSFLFNDFSFSLSPEKNYSFFESENTVLCLFHKIDTYQPVLIAKGLNKKEELSPLLTPFYLRLKESYLYEKVKVLSIRDGLTNLYKRQYFFLSLEEEIERAKTRKSVFSILIMDIDEFKSYNDRYGHLTGDCILREFGNIVRSTLRQNDLVGRYGGEEFVFFLSDTDYAGAEKMAQRLENIIKTNNFIIPSGKINITVSCGVAVFPQDGKTAEQLIEQADKRLYEMKKNKKANTV